MTQLRSTVGPYLVQRVLGAGGMGVVYAAVDPQTGERVAVKTVRLPDPKLAGALEREIHALRRLGHPGVVPVIDHGIDEGMPWLAMPLVDGQTLQAWWGEATSGATTVVLEDFTGPELAAQPAAVDWATRIGPLIPLCEALAWVHGEGVVHGDLKPANVLLGLDGLPVLVDFGLASGLGRFSSMESRVVGTPAYMAPEQRLGQPLDARTDLFAVGVLLYVALTGVLPFGGGATSSGGPGMPRLPPEAPSSLNPSVPGHLDDLALRLLSTAPSDRGGTALRIADALGRVAATWPDHPPKPVLYRPTLVGRDLAPIEQALQAGGVVVVRGPSGIGKTRLCAEVVRARTADGVRVVSAAARPADLPGAVSGVGVLDDLRHSVSRASGSGTARPATAATWTALQKLSERGPVLLAIDDLQWAERVVLELLLDVAGLPGAAVIATCGTETSVELDHWLEHPTVQVIELGPLDRKASAEMVRQLLGDEPPAELLAAVDRLTRGDPLGVLEVVRTAIRRGALRIDARGRWSTSSHDLAELRPDGGLQTLLERRLEGLGDEAARVASAAATTGTRVDPELLAAACSLSTDAVLDALRELTLRGVLEDVRGELRFVHEGLRDLARRRTPLPRSLYAELATQLEARGGGGGDLAWLVDESGDSERAMRLHREAHALYRSRGERRRSEAHLRRFLQLLPAEDPGRPDSLLDLSALCGASGRAEEAAALRDEAAGQARRLGVPSAEVRAMSALIGVALVTAPEPEIVRQTDALAARFGDATTPRSRATVAAALARAAYRTRRWDLLDEWAGRALAATEDAELWGLQGTVLGLLARAAKDRGDHEAALAFATQAVERPAHADPKARAGTHFVVGTVLSAMGRADEAVHHLTEAAELAASVRDHQAEAHAWSNVAVSHFKRGRWREGIAASERALPALRRVGDHLAIHTVLSNLAEAWLCLGRPDEAAAALVEVRRSTSAVDTPTLRLLDRVLETRIGRRAGEDTRPFLADLRQAAAGFARARDLLHEVLAWCELVHASLAAGDPQPEAAAQARQRVEVAGVQDEWLLGRVRGAEAALAAHGRGEPLVNGEVPG